jgi:hypothetical protein
MDFVVGYGRHVYTYHRNAGYSGSLHFLVVQRRRSSALRCLAAGPTGSST